MLSALIFAAPLSLLTTLLVRRWVRARDGAERVSFLPLLAASYLAWAVLVYAWIIAHGVR